MKKRKWCLRENEIPRKDNKKRGRNRSISTAGTSELIAGRKKKRTNSVARSPHLRGGRRPPAAEERVPPGPGHEEGRPPGPAPLPLLLHGHLLRERPALPHVLLLGGGHPASPRLPVPGVGPHGLQGRLGGGGAAAAWHQEQEPEEERVQRDGEAKQRAAREHGAEDGHDPARGARRHHHLVPAAAAPLHRRTAAAGWALINPLTFFCLLSRGELRGRGGFIGEGRGKGWLALHPGTRRFFFLPFVSLSSGH